MLVLPTGAGKTKTAVYWLLKNVLSDDESRSIIWIAHRAELIQQAAEAFHELSGIVNRSDILTLRCISGLHGKPITALLRPADVSLCTIQSLSRRPDIVEEYFRSNRDCVIVIDEAHHAAAKTYREVLTVASRYKRIEFLGLTATPTRTVEAEVKRLTKLFPDKILYQIDQVTLIERGILAKPICETVLTNHNFDRDLTRKQLAFLQQFGDLPASVLNKIGKNTSRNRLIVNHYIEWKNEYGQTLVFATGIAHCYALAETFKKQGIRADYVASSRHDDKRRSDILQDFRNNKLDVLISVDILTEGFDLPNIQTVFLARPTGSEILMRQMVGRGMRGPKAGGSFEVYIVSFADHWERFAGWLDPISMIEVDAEISEVGKAKLPPGLTYEIPWELISAASSMAPDIEPTTIFSNLPLGWYQLTFGDPELGKSTAVLVYDQQVEAFERFVNDAASGIAVMGGSSGPVTRYFTDATDPLPSHQSLEHLSKYISEFGKPKFISFEAKRKFDPEIIAKKLAKLPTGEAAKKAEGVYHETLAVEYYQTPERYVRAVMDEIVNAIYGKEKAVDDAVYQTKRLRRELPHGTYSLVSIRDKVRKKMKLRKRAPDIQWSKKPLRSSWGFYRKSDQMIVINSVLKTSAISRTTIEFLVYHELLHHELGVELGHSEQFRVREREYPEVLDAEAELDTLLERYHIPGMERRAI